MRLLAISVLLVSTAAVAEPTMTVTEEARIPTWSVGTRIGGYGFRREGNVDFTGKWDECRMNGVGVFATRMIKGPIFVEGGLDTYFSSTDRQPQDLQIDRSSVLLSTAAGVRLDFTSWLTGWVQLGVGAELTKVSVPYGDDSLRANKVMPEGFFGVGGDLKLTRAVHVGASIRTLVMGNFNYDPQRLDMSSQAWTSTPTADQVFDATPGLAAQGQFYMKYDL
jgi:hypothetical protein